MAWLDRRRAAALTLVALLCGHGCGVFSRREGVYIEALPASGLDPERDVALRITVFEYGDEAGGFVEFYAIDGVYNTLRSPWVAPGRCRYFGPVPVRDGRFRVVTDGDDPNAQLVMDVSWNGTLRTELRAEIEVDGGAGLGSGEGPWPLTFELDRGRQVERGCGDDLSLEDPDSETGDDAQTDAADGSGLGAEG